MIEIDLNLRPGIINFSDKEKQSCISDIDAYFQNDDWDKAVPRFQTNPVLQNRLEGHWVSLIQQASLMAQKFFTLSENYFVKSWAYVCFKDIDDDNEQDLYHAHLHPKLLCSGSFYLSVPSTSSTTLFKDKYDNIFIPALQENLILFFEKGIEHKPPRWRKSDHNENRYVVAFDWLEV